MFLIPTLLFSAMSLTMSVNNTTPTSPTYVPSNTAITNTLGQVSLYTGFSNPSQVSTPHSYDFQFGFTYDGGSYTDVPDSVDVSVTNYVWGRLYNVMDNDLLTFTYGSSNTPINCVFSPNYLRVQYYNYSSSAYAYNTWYFKSYDTAQDLYMLTRDDDEFAVEGLTLPTGFFNTENEYEFRLSSFEVVFDYMYFPYYDNQVMGDDYDIGYSTGYSNGYSTGFNEGSSSGSEQGYNVGYDDGYNVGFNDGYELGESTDTNLRQVFFQIADVPIITMRGLFDFELFGVSMYAVIGGFIALFIFIYIIRKLV